MHSVLLCNAFAEKKKTHTPNNNSDACIRDMWNYVGNIIQWARFMCYISNGCMLAPHPSHNSLFFINIFLPNLSHRRYYILYPSGIRTYYTYIYPITMRLLANVSNLIDASQWLVNIPTSHRPTHEYKKNWINSSAICASFVIFRSNSIHDTSTLDIMV